MDNQPSFDRSLIIPIVIGGFSVVGIIVVLLVGRSLNSPAEIVATPSATPFQYVYLGTEPAITTPLIEGSDIAPLTDEPADAFPTDPFPIDATPTGVTPSRPSVATPLILVTSTPTRSTAAAPNTYDDTDTRIIYSGNWIPETNVSGAYQNTLHISSTAGNSLTFTFAGQELHLFYQAGTSLGIITILFDEDTLGTTLNQAQGNGESVYMLDTAGTHTVFIRHTSGGSVNIDRLVIPAPPATPTRTPTQTQ